MVFECDKHAVICEDFQTRPQQAKRPPRCQLEHFEDITPMDNQPGNVNQWELDELDKLGRFLPQDGPHGELGMSNGNTGLTHAFWDAWKFVMESEGKCMAIIPSKKLAAPSTR